MSTTDTYFTKAKQSLINIPGVGVAVEAVDQFILDNKTGTPEKQLPAIMYFPHDMDVQNEFGSSTKFQRPVVVFHCQGRNENDLGQRIAFPIPQGIEFSDGASYDDASLDFAGYTEVGAISSSMNANAGNAGLADIAKAGVAGGINAVKQAFAAGPAAMAVSGYGIASKLGEDTRRNIGIASRISINKHVVTEFSATGTRSYTFRFKLIASSPKETQDILNIGNTFKRGVYGEANVLAIKYPPRWTIRFMLGDKDIPYIPKIWECYLQSANVNYNGSANLFHADGSPLECDITVSFKETRALAYQDIVRLEQEAYSPKFESDRFKPIAAAPINNTAE